MASLRPIVSSETHLAGDLPRALERSIRRHWCSAWIIPTPIFEDGPAGTASRARLAARFRLAMEQEKELEVPGTKGDGLTDENQVRTFTSCL